MPRRPLVFGQFLLNPDQGTLLKQGERVAVGRRGILLLEALLKRQGEVVTKEELLDAAWPGTAVEESNLSVQIALLRKAIGVDPEGREWIATVPRIGYCFAASQPETGTPDRAASSRPSVAILPFNNLSADREQAFFADGLAEEIIAALEGLRTARDRAQLELRIQGRFGGRAPHRQGTGGCGTSSRAACARTAVASGSSHS